MTKSAEPGRNTRRADHETNWLKMNPKEKRILHIITSSDPGGAETVLFNFLSQSRAGEFSHEVFSLAPLGAIGEKIAQEGIPVASADMPAGLTGLLAFPRLAKMVRRSSAALVHCWMYHANLLGGLAAARAHLPAVWHIHHHSLDPALLKKSTILVARLGARLSARIPRRIIYCADSAQSEHQRIGYDNSKGVFIPNGFDTARFAPDRARGLDARQRFSIPPDAEVVGHVGRFHPTKDHLTLLRAARIVREELPEACFVLCGRQVDSSNTQLRGWIEEMGLAGTVRLIGPQEDMPAIYNMMDMLVSSSISEAFPTVIGEAMSCGIPCAATDAGDSAQIIGNSGLLASAGNPELLADAILRLLRDESRRRNMGSAARARIQSLFSIEQMASHLEVIYREILTA